MFKALGAFVFGLAAVCGVGYLVVRKSGSVTYNQKVDSLLSKLKSGLNKKAEKLRALWESATTGPRHLEGQAA